MNRRNLFRGIVGIGAGLVLPASLEENAETARRWWALGGVPERVHEAGRINDLVTRAALRQQIGRELAGLTQHMSEQEAIIYYAIAQVTRTKTIESIPARYVIPESIKVKYGL